MDLDKLRVCAIDSREQMDQAFAIRRKVFIEEQGVPEEIELDDEDPHAFHALATLDGLAIGCGRYVVHDDYIKVGRMAVLPEYRDSGIGRRILEFLVDAARARGFRRVILHAQLTAEGFYLKNGFTPIGPVFDEAGIAHRRMERDLA